MYGPEFRTNGLDRLKCDALASDEVKVLDVFFQKAPVLSSTCNQSSDT